MFGAERISEFKPVQIERDQITKRGGLDIVQIVHPRLVTLEDRRIDEIWLKNADVDARGLAGRIPGPGRQSISFRGVQIDSQVPGCQRSVGIFRIDAGRKRKIARGGCFRDCRRGPLSIFPVSRCMSPSRM